MDAIQMLKQEHEQAKKMFAEIEQAAADARGQLWKKLKPELKVHEQLEETALYVPVAREVGSKDAKLAEWEGHHREEVSELESMIQKIGELEPSDSKWMENVKKLRQTLEHHIQEEEGEMFRLARGIFSRDELLSLADRMRALKPGR